MFEITLPKTIVAGDGALEYLKQIEGKRALIATDKFIRRIGFADKVAGYLREAGIEPEFFEVEPEPPLSLVIRGTELARNFTPDLMIGLGGGSSIDVAKAIWILYERPDLDLGSVNPFIRLGLRRKARLICIPTTSGSGSEVSWATVITNPEEERKMEIANKELVPDIAIIDPEFPMSMPQKLVADTGFDALSHAIEAYVSPLSNDFSDAIALKALQLIFKYLPRSYTTGDKESREKMHIAATMAGIAFTNSEVGLAHAIGHVIGGALHIPHGMAMAILLPYVIEYNMKVAARRYAEIARAIGIEAKTDEEAAKKLLERILQLRQDFKEPASFKDAGVSREELERKLDDIANKVLKSAVIRGNPRSPSLEEVKNLLLYIYEGKNVDF